MPASGPMSRPVGDGSGSAPGGQSPAAKTIRAPNTIGQKELTPPAANAQGLLPRNVDKPPVKKPVARPQALPATPRPKSPGLEPMAPQHRDLAKPSGTIAKLSPTIPGVAKQRKQLTTDTKALMKELQRLMDNGCSPCKVLNTRAQRLLKELPAAKPETLTAMARELGRLRRETRQAALGLQISPTLQAPKMERTLKPPTLPGK